MRNYLLLGSFNGLIHWQVFRSLPEEEIGILASGLKPDFNTILGGNWYAI